jgi:Fic family protein
MRSGIYVKQDTGYRAFIPAPLPPDPPIAFDSEMSKLLSEADVNLGRLDGVSSLVPNPDLFVAMYVRQEALLSSQIEGTECSLEEVLQFEAGPQGTERLKDIAEVVNYVHAMNYGLKRLADFPLSLRLIREIHQKLLTGVRGNEREPGEFRRSQNWIGPPGATLADATFVPPPVHEMRIALDNFEKFLYQTESLPPLIHFGLAHAQFETIHPFLDGNGRVGRLLITFLLCHRQILQRPMLYLSHFFKLHRQEYYDRLMAVRTDGNWEGWLKFFLRGVAQVSSSGTEKAHAILRMQEEHRDLVLGKVSNAALGHRLLHFLLQQPIISVRLVEKHLDCAFATANKLVEQFNGLGLLTEKTGGQRNRQYAYQPYLALFISTSA